VIIVTNHPNMLMDPLLALKGAERRVRILAKAPLFEIPVFASVLRSLDTLPLYRVQDHPDQLQRNVVAFKEAVESLTRGDTLLMFPEGKSHSEPALAPLKSGVARMALEAEDSSGWKLGVKIVPLGLTYYRKHRFRSRVVMGVGEAIEVGDWRNHYAEDRTAAARSLTAAVASALQQQTLNLSDESDRRLIETADLIYARAKGLAEWRERESLSDRLPRLRQFAEQFAWLKVSDPERWEELSLDLRNYTRRLKDLGGGDAEVPPRYLARRVLRYVVREGAVLGFTLPLAALGVIAWYVPDFLTGLVSRLMKPPIETIATVKLLAGIVLYPFAYLGWIALAVGLGGVLAGIIVAAVLPFLGYAALRWLHRRKEVAEDVRLFFQVVRHPKMRDRLAERRAALAGELEKLSAEWSLVQASAPLMASTGRKDE
jgi:1-acyl-sn-glycerol-3-phosphate acyltransferase